MKKRLLFWLFLVWASFLVFLLFLPIAFSQELVFNKGYLELELEINGRAEIIPRSQNYNVEYVIANLSFLPRDGFQEEVLSMETFPPAEMRDKRDNAAVFRWDNPSEQELDFKVKSRIKSSNKIVRLKSKVKFPLDSPDSLPDNVKEYTMPSETIDSENEGIIKKASELIKGEDDLYAVAFKLGDWTKKNIVYDLSTLTQSASQKASWVLINRKGVCDELTNLFIAMSRALGIPAKFVSGVAYTNSDEFEEGFGPHGWAEVYFPGYGWVPFDVTYGEFGFVDMGHIKLKESSDASHSSTQFQWSGRGIDIKTSPLRINATIDDAYGEWGGFISLNAAALKESTGFGSYNLIEADVQNLEDYYITAELRLSKSREIEIIGEEKKTLLLKPNEKKKVQWIVKVSDNLEEGYIYTFPFLASSLGNANSSTRFDVSEDEERWGLEGMETLVRENEEGRKEKSYLGNVKLSCSAFPEEIYEYENTTIRCMVKNTGNIYLDDVDVCIGEDCSRLRLGITQEEGVNFSFYPKKSGIRIQEVAVRAANKDASSSAFVSIAVYDKPLIEISELSYPEEVKYETEYKVSFVLNKKSASPPQDVSIRVEPLNKEWEVSRLNEDRKFVLKMYGSELRPGENSFRILINYKDGNKKSYSLSREFNVKLVDVNIFHRFILFFRHLFG